MQVFNNQLNKDGFAIIEDVFTIKEIDEIQSKIDHLQHTNWNFRASKDLFAIRHFLKENTDIQALIFNSRLKELLQNFGKTYALVKSIYFDKPPKANWTVNWHQDLTIAVKNKVNLVNFKHFLPKDDYFSVQPPDDYLLDMLTFRIHLDDCKKENGALRVVPQSHQKIQDSRDLPPSFFENEQVCEVKKGGLLLMKPLLWHSSRRVESKENRRVIHLEFSSLSLPADLLWNEFFAPNY